MKMKSETLTTLILVNFAGIMEKADEALLPGVYTEVGASLGIDPTGLGSLTLFRSIVQSLCYPLAAYFAIRHNRAHVIAVGAFLWAAATFLVGLSSTFLQIAISRGLNGVGLALVVPAIQSLVADSTDGSNRGAAFGWLQLTSGIGAIIGGVLGVMMATISFMGIPGWRLAFHLVGLISVIVGILVGLFAKDPRFSKTDGKAEVQIPRKSFLSEMENMYKEAKAVLSVRSFQIIVLQGASGSFPWSALSFTTMWLELTGFSHGTAALLWTTFAFAVSLGSLLGGKLGDIIAERLKNTGRIILSQISVGLAIPLAAILLLALPDDPSTAFLHGLAFFITGLMISWCAPATNNPIMAEIVPERSRTSIYALDRTLESILASFAPPLVGIMAQNLFGYTPVTEGSTEPDRANAASLAKALYAAIGIPMMMCILIYSFLYYTYPRDRDRARMEALASEIQESEDENLAFGQEYSGHYVSIDNQGEKRLDVVENDEVGLNSSERR